MAANDVIRRTREADFSRKTLNAGDLEFSETDPGTLSKFAEMQVSVPHSIIPGRGMDILVPAHTTYTESSGTADTQTVSLSHDLVDSPMLPTGEDVQVYRDGSLIDPAAVDYDADTVDIDTQGNGETYDLWYATSEQARLVLRITAPRNSHETVREIPGGIAALRDQDRDPITPNLSHALQGVVPTDYRIQWFIESPYSVTFENTTTGAKNPANLYLTVPVWKGQRPIEGLPGVRKDHMG